MPPYGGDPEAPSPTNVQCRPSLVVTVTLVILEIGCGDQVAGYDGDIGDSCDGDCDGRIYSTPDQLKVMNGRVGDVLTSVDR